MARGVVLKPVIPSVGTVSSDNGADDMPNRHILAGVQQALAAIDVMLRNGRLQQGQLVAMAREARVAAEEAAKRMNAQAATSEASADPATERPKADAASG